MAYTNTTLLGLNQPTTGQESGIWGDDVNNGLTQLVDLSVAGTNNITQDSDITLTVTNGNNTSSFTSTATNSTVAQYAVLNCTGARTAGRNIIVPALSKLYVVYNNTTGGFSITVKKSTGTGVTIAPGEKALCYYDNVSATDVIKVLSTTTLGTVTTGTWNASVIGAAYGGTGVANNAANTITFTGNYSLGLTLTANTTATLPTSGYLISTVTNMAANPVTGTPSSSTYLRGDGTWASIAGGVTTFSAGTTGLTPNTATSGAVTLAGTLSTANGGTGVTTTPTNGQLLIGNGTNYTVASLGTGTGISTTTGIGTLTINNTGVTSAVAGTGISVSGATGAVTITNSGVTSATAGTGVTVSGSTGSVTFSIGQAVATSSNVQFNSLGVGTAGSGTAGEIRATNNVTAYYSSDAKFKENIKDIPDALGIVISIGSKTFDWTDEYLAEHGGEDEYFQPKQSFGVIAQDVQKVFPQAVRTREDGSLAVDYEKLAILSFGAIGQLLKRVEALEAK